MFIGGTTAIKALRSVAARIARLFIFFIRRPTNRYVALTPNTFSRQIVYDRRDNRYIKVHIRDNIDWGTLFQVYLREDYGINKLSRRDDIIAIYESMRASNKTPLIIDCGGNIGLASRYFSENYRSARVLCIEPAPDNIAQAKKNNNSSANIVFVEAAIGSEMGSGHLIDPGLGNNALRISSADGGNTKIISINELLRLHGEPDCAPFIVKIDIEGYESDLFSKNIEWLEKFPLLIIELHDWMLPRTANSSNFIRSIAPLDRDFFYHGENVFSISNKIN